MQDCCEVRAEASDPAFVERLQKLVATLGRANNILVEIVGYPENEKDSVAKEPETITEKLSLEIWGAQRQADILAIQLERLHKALA